MKPSGKLNSHSRKFSSQMSELLRISGGPKNESFCIGGIFLDDSVPSSILDAIASGTAYSNDSHLSFKLPDFKGCGFLCVGLSTRGKNILTGKSDVGLRRNGSTKLSKEEALVVPSEDGYVGEEEKKHKVRRGHHGRRGGAVNTTKHLWAGAVAAMVSRFVPKDGIFLFYFILCIYLFWLLAFLRYLWDCMWCKGRGKV